MLGEKLDMIDMSFLKYLDNIPVYTIEYIDSIIYPLEDKMYEFLQLLKNGLWDHVR